MRINRHNEDIAQGSVRPGTEGLYVGLLMPDDMLMAVRTYALEREVSFSAAVRELIEEALTRPAGLRLVR